MTEQTKDTSPSAGKYETQKQRWLKYGANVALMCVLVVVLTGLVTWLVQKKHWRLDRTENRVYSLRPQTINVLNDLNQNIKLISLYDRPDKATEESDAQMVEDLLQEYRRHSSRIDVEVIDPKKNPTKVDNLIEEVSNKYGGEILKYKEFLEKYLGKDPGKDAPADKVDPSSTLGQIATLTQLEVAHIEKMPSVTTSNKELLQMAELINATVEGLPSRLTEMQEKMRRQMKMKPPAYKDAADSVEQGMEAMSALLDRLISDLTRFKDDTKVPAALRRYMAESLPNYQKMKALADGVVQEAKGLGELKLDDLRQSLRSRDAILVMGDKDMRVLPFDQVWQATSAEIRRLAAGQDVKPRFAGEQQITTAILALNMGKKIKVAFCRAGGPPLTTPTTPFQQGGPLSMIAEQLRRYNFETLEKDLTGMWAMQAQMQGQQPPPEPSDEDIKDAVWVVLDYPSTQNPMMGMGPPSIDAKVMEHLKNKGSALILASPQADALAQSLKDWGIQVKPELAIVHEQVREGDQRQIDFLEDAKRDQYVFDIRDYGNHLLTKPLQSLPSIHASLVPVSTSAAPDVTVTPILPIPTAIPAWGESTPVRSRDDALMTFDAAKGDIAAPLWAGAAAENQKTGNRVVVLGSPIFAFDFLLQQLDPELAAKRIPVQRFPANAELFTNAVFWAAKLDTLIAISPAAMEINRIGPMSKTTQNFWGIGVALIALPVLVIAAGLWTYFARRD